VLEAELVEREKGVVFVERWVEKGASLNRSRETGWWWW
jgi:hypothetical protein